MGGCGLVGVKRRKEQRIFHQTTREKIYTIGSYIHSACHNERYFLNRTVIPNTDEGERYFQNPTYEDTSTTQIFTSSSVSNEALVSQNFSPTIYNTINPLSSQALDKNGENGQVYDVLNRGESTGKDKSSESLTGYSIYGGKYVQI